MPIREDPLVNGEIYHIINRGVAAMPIFLSERHYERFLETILYYQNQKSPLRFSYFSRLTLSEKTKMVLEGEKPSQQLVEIICYCLMPNHFHFLLKQISDDGITKFMRKFSESYTHYFNVKKKRVGPIFQGRFKSVRIESEQQLLHVSRYIHLNPYSSGLIKKTSELKKYLYSSLPEYLGLTKNPICQKEIIMSYFKDKSSYEEFIFEQADYQRELSIIKHLMLENPEVD